MKLTLGGKRWNTHRSTTILYLERYGIIISFYLPRISLMIFLWAIILSPHSRSREYF